MVVKTAYVPFSNLYDFSLGPLSVLKFKQKITLKTPENFSFYDFDFIFSADRMRCYTKTLFR